MANANSISVEISEVVPDSPAYIAGFEPGCRILQIDGNAVRDMVDWRWLTSEDEIEVSYIDLDGDDGNIVLEREFGEDWGFVFADAVFDEVKTCKNACTFCFMRQLPRGMRGSLYLRDDDYRLSFLEGTFATFTNLDDGDIARIIEQRISPLRVSLHAIDPDVRSKLIGLHAQKGIAALNMLMDEGIEFDAQIVLVPDVNDGAVLNETIEWAYSHPGIKNLGIVPLGFTSHQEAFKKSFDDAQDSLRVLEQLRPYQAKALEERGFPFVYAADEFYCNAYGENVMNHIPDESFYGDYSMFEDGIGIVRSCIDSWNEAKRCGAISQLVKALDASNAHVFYICGEAMGDYASQLARSSELEGKFDFVFAKNRFFGGNVNVTGLLCGCDIASTAKEALLSATNGVLRIIAVPDVVFNVDGVTLDDWTLDDIKAQVSEDSTACVLRVGSNPVDYIKQISEFASVLDTRI